MTFYKYTSLPTANLILGNESMRWSSPLTFNDIEECQFAPFTENAISEAYEKYRRVLMECAAGNTSPDYKSYSEITKLTIGLLQIANKRGSLSAECFAEIMKKTSGNFGDNFREYVNAALIRCLRVLCVTTEYDNSLMWAHYGDQHRGCVLQLDGFFNDNLRGLRAGYIRYHENLAPTSDSLNILLCGETKKSTDSLIEDVVFSKRSSWSYEREYRFVFYESFGEITVKVDMATNQRTIATRGQPETLYTDVAFCPKFIKSIVFGARAEPRDIDRLSKLLTDKNGDAGLYQMQMRDGRLIRIELAS
jgi:hypothetical protein